ncbi:hypothetical protein K504DRAFT_492468 [Pleomassaria siparia CBS 279.74]|uniref:Uncharacterized protein n=1 Tax=Pleomassaria siparia CBS 279.74 TaxID=1314801 RepID=A0A6G1K4W2_9PLEO|nr:hypothetical protein K504DRAFT_492468 [Pleomassaria siparia CBS 279.74]
MQHLGHIKYTPDQGQTMDKWVRESCVEYDDPGEESIYVAFGETPYEEVVSIFQLPSEIASMEECPSGSVAGIRLYVTGLHESISLNYGMLLDFTGRHGIETDIPCGLGNLDVSMRTPVLSIIHWWAFPLPPAGNARIVNSPNGSLYHQQHKHFSRWLRGTTEVKVNAPASLFPRIRIAGSGEPSASEEFRKHIFISANHKRGTISVSFPP